MERYRKVTEAWATLNKKLAKTSISYETHMYLRAIDKWRLAMQFCQDARRLSRSLPGRPSRKRSLIPRPPLDLPRVD